MASHARALNRFLSPSTVNAWNSAIRASANEGLHREALLLYRQMKRSGLHPDHLTFPFLLKACALLPDTPLPQIIHAHVLKSPFSSDVFVGTAMVDMYVKCRQLEAANVLFESMPERDAAAWNVVIMGFSDLGSLDRVLAVFNRMRLAEVSPDSITIISLTRSCGCENNPSMLKAVHCLGIQMGIGADVAVANTWISAYAKCEDLGSAESVFTEISIEMRSVVSWNSMIAGYAYVGRSNEAIGFFRSMSREGVRPDLSTTVSLLSVFAHSEATSEGKLIHSVAIKAGLDSDVSFMNTLIAFYSKCGDVDAAQYCFNNMSERTPVSWTALISGYAENGYTDEAMDLFHAMEAAGERPDAVTVVAVLSACSQMGALDLGRSMNRYAIANGFEGTVLVCNALIDMYAKCGSLGEARRLFDVMHRRTIVSWTAMIMGYAINGDFTEALDLFSQMVKSGLKPNHVTLLAVLQACAHGGLLEKGLVFFDMMSKVYHIRPRLEHYACMADLLGRRGRLKEAFRFIQRMPVKPDAGVWGALLGACITHHETEIGMYVVSHLFELEPQAAASYVGMANIFAAKQRWEGVAKLRVMMKQKGIRKSPGRSIVQVNGRFHIFTVEDRTHPEGLQIYEVLDNLALLLKEAGHQTDFECLLAFEME
uniref:Pentatricopeptide repeat-containing protein At4g19191, mitochondrial n=1 Tax=Elaeis guineensis var. tenera TaxID=51953 RepID=A0A6I9RPC4_ELAGV|nr:pentatricopeptide repeat-containing protein At4g19191, mitochondrial [Elaeis guineensis]